MKVLVTGGAGYIGSHVVLALSMAGHDILTVDNLSTGYRQAVLAGRFAQADLRDRFAIMAIVSDFKPDAVMHFAAFISVEESVREPVKYYVNNTGGSLNLIEAMKEARVDKIIFSSTAALYGMPRKIPITEGEEIRPINPYGHSKACVETALKDASDAGVLRYVSLRYFNAAGADPDSRIGESHDPETHLIPLALKAALGKRDGLKIFGDDYPTADGTCVRDYIHVNDLAGAHVLALEYIADGGKSDAFNAGYGHGHSVKEVVQAVKEATGVDIKAEIAGRRPGDASELVADSAKLRGALGWKPKYDDLKFIVRTAWQWEKTGGF